MSRISLVQPEDYDPELQALTATLDTPFAQGHMRVFAHMPRLAKGWLAFLAELKADGTLDRRLIELVRLRIAFHNQCRHCMAIRFADGWAGGVDEDLVCSLEKPEDAPDLSEAERAAISFADLIATDHLGIGDRHYDALREHFSDREIVELCTNIAIFLGFGRIGATWNVDDDMPDRYTAPDQGSLHLGGEGVLVGLHQ